MLSRFSELNSTSVGVETLNVALEKAVIAENDEAFRVQELTEKLDSMNAAREKISNTYASISGSHIPWRTAFDPLLNFAVPGLQLSLATADPEKRQVVITGLANDVGDVVSYRAQVEVINSPSDLISTSLQQVENGLQYNAEFMLK